MALTGATTYAAPGEPGSPVELKERDDNFSGGGWTAPSTGEYQEDVTPSTGEPFCEVAHSGADDIELALDAAHVAKDEWRAALPGRTRRGAARGRDRIEENLEMLAVAESYDNGKPVRETIATEGGYKASGVGRENHRMMLEHYSQTKCLLVSYDQNPLGFF